MLNLTYQFKELHYFMKLIPQVENDLLYNLRQSDLDI